MFGSADWKRHARTDNKNFSLLFEAIDPFHRLIIEIIAAAKRPHERRIFVICRLRQPEIARFLAVARWTGQHNDAFFIAHLSERTQRNAVRAAAVQKLHSTNLDHMGHIRKGCRRTEIFDIFEHIFDLQILCFPCLHIAACHIKPCISPVKCLVIIRIQPFRYIMEAELLVHQISRPQPVFKAHKTLVIAVFFIIADAPLLLPRHKRSPMHCPRRDADHAVK